MGTLYLCGAGNSEGVRLALRVNEAEHRWDDIVLLDDAPEKWGSSLLGIEVVGPFDHLSQADFARDSTVNLVARTTQGRRRAGERIAAYGIPPAGLIAPGIDVFGASIAPDVLVYSGAVIGPEAEVGAGSVVFMGAVVGHESRVGPGCVVAANAVLNARVEMGAEVYIGSNATVLPEIGIGAGATIGAGSTVMWAVAAGTTVLGVPARLVVPGGEESSGESAPVGEKVDAADLERILTAAWAEALGHHDLNPEARVFDLGATSLAALRVAETVRRTTGIDLAVVDLFRFPTIGDLARHLARTNPESAAPIPRREGAAPAVAAPSRAERDAMVAEITAVFREVLRKPEAGPDSHFFELGGDPSLAQEACLALERLTGEPLCFMQVARYPTPAELARHVVSSLGQPPSCPAQGVMTRLIHRHQWHRD